VRDNLSSVFMMMAVCQVLVCRLSFFCTVEKDTIKFPATSLVLSSHQSLGALARYVTIDDVNTDPELSTNQADSARGTRFHRRHQLSLITEGSTFPNSRTSSKSRPDVPNEEGSTLPHCHTSSRTMKVQHVRGRPGYAYLRVQPEPHGVPLLNLKWLAAQAILDKAMVQCAVVLHLVVELRHKNHNDTVQRSSTTLSCAEAAVTTTDIVCAAHNVLRSHSLRYNNSGSDRGCLFAYLLFRSMVVE
jgi:hypothetical protein